MTADRTDDESGDPDAPDAPASSESNDSDDDSLTIPSVSTEDAGSGLWSDLKADFRDEEIDLPDGSTPADPLEPSSDDTDVDLSEVSNDLLETFVAVVIAVNGAVLAVSLGILFLVFEGATTHGGALLIGGLALAGFAVRRYRAYRDSSDRSEPVSDAAERADSSLEVETETEPETGTEADPELEAETEADPEFEAEADPETETETGAEP